VKSKRGKRKRELQQETSLKMLRGSRSLIMKIGFVVLCGTVIMGVGATPLKWPLEPDHDRQTPQEVQNAPSLMQELTQGVHNLVEFLSFKDEIQEHDHPGQSKHGNAPETKRGDDSILAQIGALGLDTAPSEKANPNLPDETDLFGHIEPQVREPVPAQDAEAPTSRRESSTASSSALSSPVHSLSVRYVNHALEVTEDLELMLGLLNKAVKKLETSLESTRDDLTRESTPTGPAELIRKIFRRSS